MSEMMECPDCNGSGEGFTTGTACTLCYGEGELTGRIEALLERSESYGRLLSVLEGADNTLEYVLATLSPGNRSTTALEGWTAVHEGRADSSYRQLTTLKEKMRLSREEAA